jgi:hypothetical protein
MNHTVFFGFPFVLLKPNVTGRMTVLEFIANISGMFQHSKFSAPELDRINPSFAANSKAFKSPRSLKKWCFLKKRVGD